MIIGDENDLREQLDRAFEPVTAGPAPIDGAVRRGKAIKGRRRAGAVAGLAVVVAAVAVAVPLVRHSTQAPSPASGQYTATVHVPGPSAPVGEIAYGTVNGQRWQLIASKPGAVVGRGHQLVMASGPAFGPTGLANIQLPFAPDPSSPMALTGLRIGTTQGQFGAVAADVSSVTVRLGNGIVLTLHPVTVYGARVVAFAAPADAEIVSATVYSGQREISTAIPFNDPSGPASFALWLKPGQRPAARFSGPIGSGLLTESRGRRPPASARGAYACRPAAAGAHQKFFAFAMSAGNKAVRWVAYDSSDALVTSSSVVPGG